MHSTLSIQDFYEPLAESNANQFQEARNYKSVYNNWMNQSLNKSNSKFKSVLHLYNQDPDREKKFSNNKYYNAQLNSDIKRHKRMVRAQSSKAIQEEQDFQECLSQIRAHTQLQHIKNRQVQILMNTSPKKKRAQSERRINNNYSRYYSHQDLKSELLNYQSVEKILKSNLPDNTAHHQRKCKQLERKIRRTQEQFRETYCKSISPIHSRPQSPSLQSQKQDDRNNYGVLMFQKGQLFQMGKERYIKMNQRIKNMKIDQKCPFSPDIGNKKSNEHVSRLGMWEKSRLRKMEKDAFQRKMQVKKARSEMQECTFKPKLVSKQMSNWNHVSPSHQPKASFTEKANLPKDCRFQPVFMTKKKPRKMYKNKNKKYKKDLKERLLNPQLQNQKFVEPIQIQSNIYNNPDISQQQKNWKKLQKQLNDYKSKLSPRITRYASLRQENKLSQQTIGSSQRLGSVTSLQPKSKKKKTQRSSRKSRKQISKRELSPESIKETLGYFNKMKNQIDKSKMKKKQEELKSEIQSTSFVEFRSSTSDYDPSDIKRQLKQYIQHLENKTKPENKLEQYIRKSQNGSIPMNFTKMSEDNKWKNISQYTERLKKKKSFFKKQ